MIPMIMRREDSEVTLVVHDFGYFEDSRQRSKQQVLNEGFRLVSAAVGGAFVACPPSSSIDLCCIDEIKRGASNLVKSYW